MSTLVAQKREDFRKSTLKKMRNDGWVPAVVYGKDINTESISIKNNDLLKVIREVGRNGIFSLELDGNSKNVFIQDYQNHPITGKLLHVDFLHVDRDTEIDTKVSVVLKGTSKGEKAGAIANQFLHELDVTAKASEIPNEIVIDITDFEVGHSVQVAEIKKDYSNCTFHHEDDETIMSIEYLKPELEEEEEETSEVETAGV